MVRHVSTFIIKEDSSTLETLPTITFQLIKYWIIRVESIQAFFMFLVLLFFVFVFAVNWSCWFYTLKFCIPTIETIWLFLKTRELARFNFFDANTFIYSFALPTCDYEHPFRDISWTNKSFTQVVNTFFNVKNHLKQVETLCQFEDWIFTKPVQTLFILVAWVSPIEFMFDTIANFEN